MVRVRRTMCASTTSRRARRTTIAYCAPRAAASRAVRLRSSSSHSRRPALRTTARRFASRMRHARSAFRSIRPDRRLRARATGTVGSRKRPTYAPKTSPLMDHRARSAQPRSANTARTFAQDVELMSRVQAGRGKSQSRDVRLFPKREKRAARQRRARTHAPPKGSRVTGAATRRASAPAVSAGPVR